ncbi:MAG: hypothetical protein LAO22_21325 [Acidobacteriia bacterium]|nr:hypothetical protein [Terriglobia bacterium]
MPLLDQIRDVVMSFAEKRINVTDFRQNFGHLYAQTANSDSETIELATDIESTYALFVEQLIDESELQIRLKNLIPISSANPINFQSSVETGTRGGQNLNSQSALTSHSDVNFFTATVSA